MKTPQKVSAVLRILWAVPIAFRMIVHMLSPTSGVSWMSMVSLTLLFLIAGIFICENGLLGVRSEQERRELWEPYPWVRTIERTEIIGLLILFYIAYLR